MSRLHDEIRAARARDLAKLPAGLRALAAQTDDAEARAADEQAAVIATQYADSKSRWAPVKHAEAVLALRKAELEKARAELHAAGHRAAFADLELTKLRDQVERSETALRKQLLPAHRIAAARTVLQRERARYEGGAPLGKPVNDRTAKPRDWARTAQQKAWDEAAALCAKALDDLEHYAAGLIEPPKDLAVWLDRVCDDAAARVAAVVP